ncbi:AbiH family protein [Flavobacterium sp. 25HG05S-40]|uniref:AbiH family protein n=1 Tax=Flavobacterium sp. 25HG05S-40 TaxID=3458682 RepID=UPI004043B16C
MNRLIIIGNGFDLAHGIKTSYKDFIAHYFSNAMRCIYLSNGYHDELIEIHVKSGHAFYHNHLDPITPENSIDTIKQILTGKTILHLQFKSILLKKSFEKIDKLNWVDLEIEYFNTLLATKHAFGKDNQLEEIKKVNKQLDSLKEKLIEYLKKQQSTFSNGFIKNNLVGCFTESINPHEVVTTELEESQLPKSLFFLNFNYTSTFENYYDICRKKIASDLDYIHGSLDGVHGEPVFGFGDELDKNYLEFEDEKNNELFRHIKSFEYLKNKNYYRLIRFIESNDYQVQIYGHSCGLSDRTMLNQIFEHENCKSIKIFYHHREDGTNDYTEKTYEISRHFKDKGMMRKKVVPFDYSQEMPQPNRVNK